MKFFTSLLFVALAALAGFIFEPQLRLALTGIAPAPLPAAPPATVPTATAAPAPISPPKPIAAAPKPLALSKPAEIAPPPAPVPPVKQSPAPAVPSAVVEIPSPADAPIAVPEETPAAAPAATVMTPVVAAMQASLQNGDVTEFTFENVTEWTTGSNETLNGKNYQTGFANCELTTVFGSRRMQAKAYILNDQVAQWVWPKSNIPIK